MNKGLKYIITKTISYLLIALLPFFCFSQYDLEKITYDEANNFSYFKKIKNNTSVKTYISSEKVSISVGDTLIIGNPTSTTSHTDRGFTTNSSKTFHYISYGRPAGFGKVLFALEGYAPIKLQKEFSGDKTIIKEIRVRHRGSKKKPLVAFLILGEINGRAFGSNKYLTVSGVEQALNEGEIEPLNAPMSRKKALDKLEESKRLYDLGVISKEEYEEVKQELIIIKSNQP